MIFLSKYGFKYSKMLTNKYRYEAISSENKKKLYHTFLIIMVNLTENSSSIILFILNRFWVNPAFEYLLHIVNETEEDTHSKLIFCGK